MIEFVLDGLVSRSVLEAQTGPDGTRYRMLATLQAFGRERLREAGELDHAQRALAHWVSRRVISVDIASRTADQLGALAGLDAHYADVTAALRWAADHDVVLALRIAGNVAYPWWMVERYGDAMEWLERLLPSVDDDPSIPPAVAARALAMSGYLGSMGGWGYDRSRVRACLDRSIARGRRAIELLEQAGKSGPRADHAAAGFRQMLAISLVRRHIFLGRKTTADVDELLDEALSRHEEMGDLHGVGMCHAVGAIAALAVGDIDLADARVDDAARYLTPFGDRFGLERIAWMRGLISEGRGDLLGARAGYEAALAYATELRMREAVASHERQLATVNDAISAPMTFDRSGTRSDALRATDTLATAAALHLHLALRQTDAAAAAAAGRRALSWYRDLGIVHGEVVALVSLAVIAVDARHLAVAAYLLDEAAAIGWLAEDPELDALDVGGLRLSRGGRAERAGASAATLRRSRRHGPVADRDPPRRVGGPGVCGHVGGRMGPAPASQWRSAVTQPNGRPGTAGPGGRAVHRRHRRPGGRPRASRLDRGGHRPRHRWRRPIDRRSVGRDQRNRPRRPS